MLRRAALLLCLAVPAAAGAQLDTLTITPTGPFGVTDCSPDNPTIVLTWTLVPTSATYNTGDKHRILASTSNTCPTADTNLIADPAAIANSATYPSGGATLRLMDIVGKAATDCTGTADKTIYVCVALRRSGATTDEKTKVISFTLQLAPPPVPTSLSISPGDSALNISWSGGTVTTGLATTDRYRVTVTPQDAGLDPGGTRTTETGGTSHRQAGLVNGATYDVKVLALSSGGNASATVDGIGTPQPVQDFFTYYQTQGGAEQGGCAGGPAGLLSLLGVGAALRAFRRRS